jgi:hypothetical protein
MIVDSIFIEKVVDYVIKLEDDFDSGLAKGSVEFYMGMEKLKPIKKNSGIYVFLNLPLSNDLIEVRTEYYHNVEIEINRTSLKEKIHVYRLKPNAIYPYFKNSVVINFNINLDNGEKFNNKEILIISYLFGELDYTARVVDILDDKSVIKATNSKVKIGDEFTNRSSKGAIRIIEIEKDDSCKLDYIKEITLDKGDKLYKALVTRASSNGSCVLYFNDLHKKNAQVKLLIFYKEAFKEVTIEIKENSSYNLGVLHI